MRDLKGGGRRFLRFFGCPRFLLVPENMNTTQKRIVFALAEALFLVLGTLMVSFFLAIDILYFGNDVSEISLTEIAQEVMVFVTAVIFGVSAWSRPESRGFLVLACGFFACIFIRELDALFDVCVCHGFWIAPAALAGGASLMCAVTCRGTVLEPLVKYIGTKSQIFVLIGLVVLTVLGRFMGSGRAFWRYIMGDSYTPLFKNVMQEGLELFGYFLIFYGACLLLRPKEVAQGDRTGF